MAQPIRIGLIGLDTSHVSAFTKLLNDPQAEFHIPGARVTVAWPGGSPGLEMSTSRIEKFTSELRDQHGVTMVDSPEAVAEAADLVFIESVDGGVHLEQFKRVVGFRKPTFIDKPFALSVANAREMFDLAETAGIPLMSCSSLRYADGLTRALAAQTQPILSTDIFGPMTLQESQPGLFWYGIHSIEMVTTIMGTGCSSVRAHSYDSGEFVSLEYADGRVAGVHGLRNNHARFGVTLHRKDGFEHVDIYGNKPYYACMLEAILHSLPARKSAISPRETLEIIAIIEAANQSRATGAAASVAQF